MFSITPLSSDAPSPGNPREQSLGYIFAVDSVGVSDCIFIQLSVVSSEKHLIVSGGSTLGPGGTGPPNLAQPPKFLDAVVLLLVELIGSIVNFA